ncbi:MAG TPA: hypothetical protein VFV58_02675 [Blastocatellia bacterium]|jgi:hypothetical protein|nr:hypothetical protein [Blastocatellia bacterium]
MKLEFVPLLEVQRDLYRLPRGWERFRVYLQTMVDPETNDVKLPLSAVNPMGKDHVPALLDQYLAFGADGVAARAVAEAESRLSNVEGEFKVTLLIVDDAMGGWTNRYSSELSARSGSKPIHKRGWITGTLWTSETPSANAASEETLTAVYRAAHIQQHGFAVTLREIMAQEGYAMAMAGCSKPSLDDDELDYAREVIAPSLDTRDYPVIITSLFGDVAAASLGYTPLGLSERAGFALALHEARFESAKAS